MNNKLVTKNNNENKIDKKKITVNYYCVCKKKYNQNDKISFALPCSHMFHNHCIQNKTHCPICNIQIKKKIHEDKIFSNSKYKLYQNDINAVKVNNTGIINYLNLPYRIINAMAYINSLILSKNSDDLINGCDFFFNFVGMKINFIDNTTNKDVFYIKDGNFKWTDKYKNKKKIIISNHSHYLDSYILFYIFKCGFVSSDAINKIEIGRIIAYACKLLIFKRGVDTNMVEKIKKYLEEQKEIVIYPEGIMKDNNDILVKFRTGAFYTGADICPIIIKYKNFIYDDDFKQLLFKLITQHKMEIDIHICDFQQPPFNDEKIENIRKHMAKVGNLKLSRISNKNIVE
jgi:hypothetical protein